MIDINLLNKKGVYGSSNSDFNNIDDEIQLTDNNLESKIENSSENDLKAVIIIMGIHLIILKVRINLN